MFALNRATDLCFGASSSSLSAASPTSSAPVLGDPGSIIGVSLAAGEGDSMVSVATGRVSGEGWIYMATKTSSLLETGRTLSGARAESKAPRAPGAADSLESMGGGGQRVKYWLRATNGVCAGRGEVRGTHKYKGQQQFGAIEELRIQRSKVRQYTDDI